MDLNKNSIGKKITDNREKINYTKKIDANYRRCDELGKHKKKKKKKKKT